MPTRNFNKEVLPNNELWRRGGKLNQKRHIDLTEEEKVVLQITSTSNLTHKK